MKNIFFLLWFKLIRYLERCLHLHISTGNVPIASVLPRTPQRQVVAQVEPQVIRHRPEDVRHHPAIIFIIFLKRTWPRLLSLQTGRGSRLSRVPFESSDSPLRPFIIHIFYIFGNKRTYFHWKPNFQIPELSLACWRVSQYFFLSWKILQILSWNF